MTKRNNDGHKNDNDHGHGGGASKTSNLIFFGDSLTDNGNLFKLIGEPAAPWWKGRFSNGPTYAEQLPALLGVVGAASVQNYAFGGARSQNGNPIPIDLDVQVQSFIASLHDKMAPKGTEAVLYIGNNDYLNFQPSDPTDPVKTGAEVQAFIGGVIGHIQTAILSLKAHGVEKIVLFTLPHFSITPAGQFLASSGPAGQQLVAGADAIIDGNNAALKALVAADAAAGIDITIVDANIFADAVGADSHAFGFKGTNVPIITGDADAPTGITGLYEINEIAFYNDIHPTYAAHGAQAAFADATLMADHVQLYALSGNTYKGSSGVDFIFAVQGNNLFRGGSGNDIIYAGNGNSTVYGDSGSDLLFAGGGNNKLFGGSGADLLAVNSGTKTSFGGNELDGGSGDDILIANRSVTNTLRGGSGDDLIIFKEDAGALFAHQIIDGGSGDNVLRFIINDHSAAVADALKFDFQSIVTAFKAAEKTNHAGTFTVGDLDIRNISGLQLQVDSVSNNAATPYLIDHTILQTAGEAPEVNSAGAALLQQAALWGLLTA